MKSIIIPIPHDVAISGWIVRALDRWADRPAHGTAVTAYAHTSLAEDVGDALDTWCSSGFGLITNDCFVENQVRVECD